MKKTEKYSAIFNYVVLIAIISLYGIVFLRISNFGGHTLINLLLVCLIGIFILKRFLIDKFDINKKKRNYLIVGIITILISSYISLLTGNMRFFKTLSLDLFFLIAPAFLYVFMDERMKKISFYLIIFFFTINNLILSIGLVLGLSYFVRSEYAYCVIYATVPYIISLIIFIFKNSKKINNLFKLVLYFSLIISLLSLILAGFMIALIAFLASLYFCVLLCFLKSRKQKIVFLSISVVLIVGMFFAGKIFLPKIAEVLARINIYYYERINDIYLMIYQNQIGMAMQGRINRYSGSLDSISNYFLFGVCWRINDKFPLYYGTSYHSTLLDNFAFFGFFYFLLYLVAFFGPLFFFSKERKISSIIKNALPGIICVFIIVLIDNASSMFALSSSLFYMLVLDCNDYYSKHLCLKI